MARPWADHPFALISTPPPTDSISKETLKVATEMSLAHNLLLRQLNAIYLQCTSVTLAQDKSDFLLFSQTWWEGIHHHHSSEERYFFPRIEEYTGEKGIMEKNVEQHEAFAKGLEEFKAYVFDTDASVYEGKKLRAIIDGFGDLLVQHLRDEISTLLELEKYGGKKLAKAWADLEDKVKAEIDNPYRLIPMAFGAVDKTFEGGSTNIGRLSRGFCRICANSGSMAATREVGDLVLVLSSVYLENCLL